MDEMQLFCLLDLLMRPLSQSASSEVSYTNNATDTHTQLSCTCVAAAFGDPRSGANSASKSFGEGSGGDAEGECWV